jgi:nicotinamidase-related amidase
MIIDSLFDQLDLNHDGNLSRSELHPAAIRLGWHWHEAPILALLDLLTLHEPISRKKFTAIMHQIQKDPMGPYGDVLLNSPHFSKKSPERIEQLRPRRPTPAGGVSNRKSRPTLDGGFGKDLAAALEKGLDLNAATSYQHLLDALDTCQISADDAALLVIDPQRSFTEGAWMQSIGDGAAVDVVPIAVAVKSCAHIIKYHYCRMEIMFTRCPFPPGSFDWDDRLTDIIDRRQLYFIKPGNSALFPRFNGFRQWAARCIEQGITTLVLGGCTLNSCVRVSSIEILQQFKSDNLRVVVDLSICGARLRNYIPSPLYGEVSAVASAVSQMTAAGVQVVKWVDFR